VDGAAGRALDGSAEQTPDGAWAEQNGVDGLAGLEVAQHRLFPIVQLVRHQLYLVKPWELSWESRQLWEQRELEKPGQPEK